MRRKVLNAISTIAMALVMFVLPIISTLDSSIKSRNYDEVTAQTRTVSANNSMIDYESIFKEYDNANLTQEGSLTTFEGDQTLKLDKLELEDEELDEEDLKLLENGEVTIRYKYTFDYVTDKVSVTAVMVETTSDGEINETIVDTIEGKAFINDAGEIDAELDFDGELILLSELQDLGVIDNCGLFKKIGKAIKKATKTAIGVVGAVATVVVPAVIGVACAVTGVGLVATVVAGAVAGTVLATSTTIASTVEQDGKVDWETVGICAGVGAVVGAVVSGVSYGITQAVQSASATKGADGVGKTTEGATKATETVGKTTKSQAKQMLKSVEDNRKNHILQQKHGWDKVCKGDWKSVSNTIENTLTNGTAEAYKTGTQLISSTVNGQTVQVQVKLVDNVLKIVDAWVKLI